MSGKNKAPSSRKRSVISGDNVTLADNLARRAQTCIVSGDGREFDSSKLSATGFNAQEIGTSAPCITFSEQNLPLPTLPGQFLLTDTNLQSNEGAFSRSRQSVSLPYYTCDDYLAPPALQPGLQLSVDSIFCALPPCHAPLTPYGSPGIEEMLSFLDCDPWIPQNFSEEDEGLFTAQSTNIVDVSLVRDGVNLEPMDMLDEMDLSMLNEFSSYQPDLSLIDPVSLDPTTVPVENTEIPAPLSSAMVPPGGIVLSGNESQRSTGSTGEIADCLQMMKLMKNKAPLPFHQESNAPANLTISNSAASPVTSTTLPQSVAVSASQMLHCSSYTNNKELVLEISDAIFGLKSPTQFCAHIFYRLLEAAATLCNLQVAHAICAKLPQPVFENKCLFMKIPIDCITLDDWLKQCKPGLIECMRVYQEIVNTLVTIATGRSEQGVCFWGCFAVGKSTVYLVPDFPKLLQKQDELSKCDDEVDPHTLDQKAVVDLLLKLIGSFDPSLTMSRSLREKIRLCPTVHLADLPRVLGEKRLCRLCVTDDSLIGHMEMYCVEQEKLDEALSPVKQILPSGLWGVYWRTDNMKGVSGKPQVRKVEMATPDRKMDFVVAAVSDVNQSYVYFRV